MAPPRQHLIHSGEEASALATLAMAYTSLQRASPAEKRSLQEQVDVFYEASIGSLCPKMQCVADHLVGYATSTDKHILSIANAYVSWAQGNASIRERLSKRR